MGVDNAAVARRYMTEIWGKGNLDVIDELVDPEIVLRDPMSGEAMGIDVVRARSRDMTAAFGDASLTIDDVVVAGDRVILRHTWRAVHRGEFFGFEGTGRTLTVKVVELLRLRGGKVVENITYLDAYGIFQQLGILPPPDELARTLASKAGSFVRQGPPRS